MARAPQEFETHPAPFPETVFRAVCRRVIDGDTVDVVIDLGFNVYAYETIRVRGVNTPELHAQDPDERQKAIAARERTRSLVEGKPVMLTPQPDHITFGRYVSEVRYLDGQGQWVELTETLLREGLGVVM